MKDTHAFVISSTPPPAACWPPAAPPTVRYGILLRTLHKLLQRDGGVMQHGTASRPELYSCSENVQSTRQQPGRPSVHEEWRAARHLQGVRAARAAAEDVRVVLAQEPAQRGADVGHARDHPRLRVPCGLLEHALQRVSCKRSGTSVLRHTVIHLDSSTEVAQGPTNPTFQITCWG